MGYARERYEGHTLEERSDRRVLFDPVDRGVEKLRAARNEEGQTVTLDLRRVRDRMVVHEVVRVVVAVIVFDDTDNGHLLVYLFHVLGVDALVQLDEIVEGVVLAQLHLVAHIHHLGGEHFAKAPVFRVVRAHAADLVGDYVGDLLRQLGVVLLHVLFVLVFASDGIALLRHKFTPQMIIFL